MYKPAGTSLNVFNVGDYGCYLIDYNRDNEAQLLSRIQVPKDVAHMWMSVIGYEQRCYNKEFVCVVNDRVIVFIGLHDHVYWLYTYKNKE